MRQVILALILFFYLFVPIQAQTIVYFPLITKECDMATFAVLEITDGTDAGTVNLLNIGNGLHLNDWNRAVIQPKGGGTFQSSSLAPSRRLVNAVNATGFETLELKVNGSNQDALITELQNFFRLLLKARDYWLSDWQDVPVYIRARAACETNEQFAHILNFSVEQLDNPYAQPFFSATQVAAMDNIILAIERNHWSASPPGDGECTQISTLITEVQFFWTLNSTQPGGAIEDIIEATSGFMIATDDVGPEVWRNNTGGAVWTASTTPPAGILRVLEEFGGFVYLGSSAGIYRSGDNGDNWVLRNANLQFVNRHSLIGATDGFLYAIGDLSGIEGIHRSNDGGTTWTTVLSSQAFNQGALLEGSDGFIYAANQSISRSSNGTTWTEVLASTSPATFQFEKLMETSLYLFAFGNSPVTTEGPVFRSNNTDGATWVKIASLENEIFDALELTSGGILVSGGVVGRSMVAYGNDAFDWWDEHQSLNGTNERFFSIVEFSGNDDVYAGESGDIFQQDAVIVTPGRAATCNKEAYPANKINRSQFTHIFIFDASGPTFTSQFPAASFPFDLFPDPAAAGDIIYFGLATSVVAANTTVFNTGGPCANLIFDIDTRLIAQGANTFIWEYSQGGAAWNTLTVQDNTDNVYPFDKGGVNAVCFEQPSDWAEETVNSVTGLWIRLRISAVGTWVTTPTQQSRDIYTSTIPYIEAGSTIVTGDVPALIRIRAENISDRDGRGGNPPNLWINRMIVGLRSLNRGASGDENFQAYINISDEQLPPGIRVSADTNTTFVDDIQTPTGRRATYNPVGVEAMATRATITLVTSIARDFYGEFHVFLRGRRTGGVVTDFNIQLQISTGSGGIQFTTESKQFQTTTAWEVLDFGQIKIPVFGTLRSSDIGDQTEIRIQASAANAAIDLYLYDLILIPVDEWSGDFIDSHNQDESIVGRDNSVVRLLDLDSVLSPKSGPQALVRESVSGFITSAYNVITNGQVILQANTDQRLWFFVMQTSAVGGSLNWIAPFETIYSIQMTHNARYLGLRGER